MSVSGSLLSGAHSLEGWLEYLCQALLSSKVKMGKGGTHGCAGTYLSLESGREFLQVAGAGGRALLRGGPGMLKGKGRKQRPPSLMVSPSIWGVSGRNGNSWKWEVAWSICWGNRTPSPETSRPHECLLECGREIVSACRGNERPHEQAKVVQVPHQWPQGQS